MQDYATACLSRTISFNERIYFEKENNRKICFEKVLKILYEFGELTIDFVPNYIDEGVWSTSWQIAVELDHNKKRKKQYAEKLNGFNSREPNKTNYVSNEKLKDFGADSEDNVKKDAPKTQKGGYWEKFSFSIIICAICVILLVIGLVTEMTWLNCVAAIGLAIFGLYWIIGTLHYFFGCN